MPVPGASNITFAARTRGTFNVSNAPGGQIIKYNSVANPNFVRPFAEPPSQLKLQPPQSAPQALPNLRGASQPLPNLAELSKPTTTPLKPTISTGSGAVAAAGATVGVVASGGIASSVSSGNLITLAALIWASNAIQLYKLWGLSQPESQAELNIEVGQESALYEVEAYYNWVLGHFNEPRERPTGYYKGIAQGPIKEAISTYPTDPVGGFTFDNVRFALTGKDENGNDKAYPLPLYRTEPNQQVFASGYSHNYIESGGILGAKRVDGQVDPQPLPQRQRQAQPLPQQPFPEFAEPEPPKPKGKVVLIPNLAPLPEKRSIRLEIPSNLPITITSPGQAPIQVQQPQNTSGDPTTVTIPRNISPGEDQPIQIQQPGGQPITFTSSSTSPFTINIPGYQPITIDPQKSGQPKGAIADPVQLGRFSPTPIPATAPTPGTPTNPGTTPTATPKPATTDDLEQFKKDLEKLLLGGTALAGLTPAIQAIGDRVNQTARQTTPEAIATAAETGTCNAFAPNGCNADIKQNAQKAADNSASNSNKLDQVTAGISGLDALQGADTNARVRNIEDKTGSNEYPMILPEYTMEDSLDKEVVITNQAQFNAWQVRNTSALFGMFPIKIERQNENGTKETLKLENLAETLAEFVGIYSKIAFDADTAVNVGIRAVAESIGARTAALQAGSYLKAIIDYLGFQTQPEAFPIKISCTIGATGVDGNLQESELEDFLKPSIQNVIGIDCKEQDDLHTIIKRILFDAEIARAALYKPLKPDKINNSLAITGDGIKAHRKKEEEKVNKKWEEFKAKIEGQTNLPFKVDIDEKGTDTTK